MSYERIQNEMKERWSGCHMMQNIWRLVLLCTSFVTHLKASPTIYHWDRFLCNAIAVWSLQLQRWRIAQPDLGPGSRCYTVGVLGGEQGRELSRVIQHSTNLCLRSALSDVTAAHLEHMRDSKTCLSGSRSRTRHRSWYRHIHLLSQLFNTAAHASSA